MLRKRDSAVSVKKKSVSGLLGSLVLSALMVAALLAGPIIILIVITGRMLQ